MRKTFRIWLTLALCCSIMMGIVPAASGAGIEPVSMTYINPIYQDVLTQADLAQPGPMLLADVDEYHRTPEAAGEAIREDLKARQETILVGVTASTWSDEAIRQLMMDVFTAAIAHTGVPTEGDYIQWQFGGYSANASAYSRFGTYYVTITYTMTYYTTAEQEAQMDTAVAQLLEELDLEQASDYQTVEIIYDWICDNITYDYDNTYLLKHTAYAALINRTAVCQGYAVLLYRLLLEEGIDCRVIVGDSGGPHAWNIIEMDGLYYNADSTWDAGRSSYRYFLLSPDKFTNHTREAEYDTEAFHAAYPMGTTNYTPPANCSCGDASGDGTLNIEDILLIRERILHNEGATGALTCGDLNCNGRLDVGDIVTLQNLILAG